MRNSISRIEGGVFVDNSGLKNLAKELADLGAVGVPDAARIGLRAIVNKVRDRARRNASYSKRIPGSIRGRVSVRGFSGSVAAGGAKAPNAVPIENKGKGYVRHPIFVKKADLPGPPGSWTDKNSHPAFLSMAVEEDAIELQELVDHLLDGVLEEFCRE
jgi:hypothetical protein